MSGMATMRPRRRAVTAVRGHTKTGVHGWPGLTPGHDGRGKSGGNTDQLHMQLPSPSMGEVSRFSETEGVEPPPHPSRPSIGLPSPSRGGLIAISLA